eukprot:7290312-Lingulodinium_polyedra.AAC.1
MDWYQTELVRVLEDEHEKLCVEIGKSKEPVWHVGKPASATMVVKKFGWDRARAESTTVGQL